MMKKRLAFIATLLCVSLVFCACSDTGSNNGNGSNNTSNTTNEEEEAYKSKLNVLRPVAYSKVDGLNLEPGSCISIIGRYFDDSYWKQVEEGARQAITDMNTILGYKGDNKIKLIYSAPEIRDDIDEQVNILDEELSRYPVAIGIAAIDTTACSIQFDLAAENKIPIVTFDSGSDYQHIAAHVSTDNLEAAKTAAAKLAHAMDQSGDVAIFVQDSTSMTSKQRLQGFTETIASNYPNVSIVTTYHLDELKTMQKTIASEKNAALAAGKEPINPEDISQEDIVKYLLGKNPNLKGIYTTNLDTTQLVADVLSELKRNDLKFVGFDGGDEQMELLENGILDGLVIQNPYGMGYATVVAAARVSLGLANESFVDTGYTWVTKDNMNTTKIKRMLY